MASDFKLLKRKYWIFDLDGTLTVAVHDFDKIRSELGLTKGQLIIPTLESLPEEESLPLRMKLQKIEEKLALAAQPATGVNSLLETLDQKGYTMGILTLNSRENAWITLKTLGLEKYFSEETVFGRWCIEPKPSPKGIIKLMTQWKISQEQTLVIGDFLYDLQVGKSAGTATVHVDPKGEFKWPELADIQVQSFDELTDYLTQNKDGNV